MRITCLILVVFLTGCSTTKNSPSENTSSKAIAQFDEEKSLNAGYELIVNGKAFDAINKHLKGLTERCEEKHGKSEDRIYAARTSIESIFYMMQSMAEKKNSIVISPTCAESNYYMGYANVDLGRIKQGEHYLKRALDYSPLNSMYLSELAHVHQINKNWDKALTLYSQAEEAASVYSPEQLKLSELTRAKRGIGFVLIELGELQKAKLKFEESLKLDPNDKNSLSEINYIKGLKGKS